MDNQNFNKQELYEPYAEQALLSSLLIDGSLLEKIQAIIPEAKFFFNAFYQSVYQTMLDLVVKNTPIDAVTLSSVNKSLSLTALTALFDMETADPLFAYASVST